MTSKKVKTILVHRGLESSPAPEEIAPERLERYLQKHNDCYEIAFLEGTAHGRAFIDLDGKFFGTEEDFHVTNETVQYVLASMDFGTPYSLMCASKYRNIDWRDQKVSNKLSWRITFTQKAGSKEAVKHWTLNKVMPQIKEEFEKNDIDIPVYVPGDVGDEQITYLKYDPSVYAKNKKMRCWNSSKPREDRPNVIVGEATLLDTCITYIPDDVEILEGSTAPAPVKSEKTKVAKQRASKSDEKEEEEEALTKEQMILKQVVDNLALHRWNNYQDFINVGIACFHEGLPLSVWETNAAKGYKNKPGDCAGYWRGWMKSKENKQGPMLTQATLWHMLKQDNPEVFKELNSERTDFLKLIQDDTHYEVAKFFFNCRPNDYMYDKESGWWAVMNNSQWENTKGKNPPPNIKTKMVRIMAEQRISCEQMLAKKKADIAAKNSGTDKPMSEEDKEKINKLDNQTKQLYNFKKGIESDGNQKGIINFLLSFYDEQTKQLLAANDKTDVSSLMDSNPNLFAFTDGCYDFEQKVFRPITPTDYISINCCYAKPQQNPEVRKQIQKTLWTIWEDDACYNFIMDILSSCMCGQRNMEAFFILTGRGRNGKGLLWELVMRVMGNYHYALPDSVLTKRIDNPAAPNPDVANLRGVRCACATEPETNEPLMEGTIKKMTGGDPLTGRALYGNPITFKPQFGLFLQCNNIPNFNQLTQAGVKRNVVVPFPFVFVDEPKLSYERKGDPRIKNVLCKSDEWRDEMCLMLLENYERVQGKAIDAIPKPQLVKDATNAYTEENNAVGAWWMRNYEQDEEGALLSREVFESYKTDTGDRITDKAFKAALAFNDVDIVKLSRGAHKGLMGIKGWRRVQQD